MIHDWNHPMCDDCWEAAEGPGRVRVDDGPDETCCFCGAHTNSGITVRAAPGSLPYCPDRPA